eukprot:1038795-Amphidinium_carterae.1
MKESIIPRIGGSGMELALLPTTEQAGLDALVDNVRYAHLKTCTVCCTALCLCWLSCGGLQFGRLSYGVVEHRIVRTPRRRRSFQDWTLRLQWRRRVAREHIE